MYQIPTIQEENINGLCEQIFMKYVEIILKAKGLGTR